MPTTESKPKPAKTRDEGQWALGNREPPNPNEVFKQEDDALNVRARRINDAMQLAAARAIAGCISPRQLHAEYIVPSVFNKEVVKAVAAAVEEAAIKTGVARRSRRG